MLNKKEETLYWVGTNDNRCEHDIKNNIYPCDTEKDWFILVTEEDED